MRKKFLIDTNALGAVLKKHMGRSDLVTLKDVVDEMNRSVTGLSALGVDVRDLGVKHFRKMADVMREHGENDQFISLARNKGRADVALVAFLLGEEENPGILFADKFVLVTRDNGLKEVLKKYGVSAEDSITERAS